MSTLRLRSDLVEWQLDDDRVMARDLRTSRQLALNATAAVLWQALAVGATEGELIEELVERFEVDVDVATQDVAAFIEDLHGRGLLSVPST